ncbi:MAG: indole-3-glycerol phosphate synthase TrpC [Acidimicrobiia bacterium]|nr:indole-3-glycerol phosphate synthase TrpC [Acidimicrobiia bacterium]
MSFLEKILATKRDEVAGLRGRSREITAAAAAATSRRSGDFYSALRAAPGLAVIAEMKRRSPSKGPLAPDLDPASMAASFEAGGASAISVLTDAEYFGGSLDDLAAARSTTSLPLLRKDFVIDELQVLEARAAGADAILLIVAALSDAQLSDLLGAARSHGLAALVEVHDAEELDRALSTGCDLVGVNSRSLATFDEDLGIAHGLVARIPDTTLAVAESAIRSVEDARSVAAAGFRAALVGEALVRAADPAALVADMAAVEPAVVAGETG